MEEQIFDGEFFQKLNTLKMTTRLKLNSGMGGGRKSNAKGSSVEFSDFREYMLGDDIRRIDWNAYGRMNRLFVKLFMEEKEGLFHILVDCSKSMDYGQQKKSILALRIAGILSYLIINNLDRVTITAMKERSLYTTKSMTGRQSFQKLLNELEHFSFDEKVDIEKILKRLNIRHKGVTIIISDFFDQDRLEDAIKYLIYKNQEVILIHTLAREEILPEAEGTLRLLDVETTKDMKVTISPKLLKEYKRAFQSFIEELTRLSKKYHLSYLQAVSDKPLDQFIYEGIRTGNWGK